MNVGEAAKAPGVSAWAIRGCASTGLILTAARPGSG